MGCDCTEGLALDYAMCIMQPMHKPSDTFLRLIDEAGGVPAAAKVYDVPAPTLYCVRNGTRRMGRALAELLQSRTGERYRAADLLGLTTDKAA